MSNTDIRATFTLWILFLSAISCNAAVTLETVPVRNPGNGADPSTGHGSVPHPYRMGKFEVTNDQYVEFLNNVDPMGQNSLALYDEAMTTQTLGGINLFGANAPGAKYQIRDNRGSAPVIFVSWYDTIRFANWMHNGQGSGDTETGAYTLGPIEYAGVPFNGSGINRNPGAKWWLPNEDEWYKAAYHKNNGATNNYWLYATSTNTPPYSDQPPGADAPTPSNTANFQNNDGISNMFNDGFAVTGLPMSDDTTFYYTNVGSYKFSLSPYGTLDQAGNANEWVETLEEGFYRRYLGSSWVDHNQKSSHWVATDPSRAVRTIGFRIATVIPEPHSLSIVAIAFAVTWCRYRAQKCARVNYSVGFGTASPRPSRVSSSLPFGQASSSMPISLNCSAKRFGFQG